MASVENLSDGEIRLKLAELGYPVGPITATTRKVLAKKLKLLLDQSKVPGGDKQDSKSRVSLASFSSGEDSEDDAKVTSRKSMPPPPPKPSSKRRSVSRSKELIGNSNSIADITVDSDLYPSASSTLKPKESPPKFKKGPTSNHNYNNVTNSSPDRDLSRRSIRKSYSPANSFRLSRSYNAENANTDPFDTGSDSDIGNDRRPIINHNKSPDVDLPYSPLTDLGFTKNFRSRFQSAASSSSYESPLSYSSLNLSPGIVGNNDGSPLFKSSQPYSSDFVRKLSATSHNRNGSGLSSGLTSKLLDVKESDDEDVPAAYSYSQIKSRRLRRDGTSKTDSGRMWKNTTTVSMGLLLFLVLFFGGLTVIYLNVTYKDAPIAQTDTNLPICRTNGKVGVECILDAEMQPAMTLFRELFNDLQNHAISVKCSGETDKSTALSDNQLIQLIVEKKEGMNVWDVEKQLRNVKILIKANPKWGIEVTENGLDMPFPGLPVTCSLINMAYMILGYGARLVLVILAIYGGQKGVRWWVNRQEHNKKEVFRLVESIIELLSNHQQAGNGDNFLAINHVRDQLIPPHQRQQMASIWNQAVAYLEENDSRVRVEIQQVAGEDFHVWHWLPSPRSNGRRKVWQGQAFETMEGSVNSLPVSPTQCLKIRHMFEPDVEVGEDWVTRVQDAILEKCEGVKVLHVAVDKNSQEGCVYVKCSSPEEAGRAYRALHGSWFDSKLVTVKYLHLKRYHERFPEAAQAMGPLRPSNDRKLSLQ